ncbi:Mitotic checkpoint protein BUB3 [Dirofilaria immitis]|nr:Mitotic checkpoint protein BUB3 [Dirofilaria immitis]
MFHFAGGSTEGTIPHPSNTQISKVQFSPDDSGQLLAVSSWEGTVRIYHFPAGPVTALEKRVYTHAKPVLACTFFTKNDVASGGLDSVIKTYNMETGIECVLGHHDAPVRCLEYCKEHSLVVSGGWDSAVMLWDARSKSSAGFGNNGDKVYAMDTLVNRILIGTKDRKIIIWDVRNLGEPEQIRDSPLKFQTRAVKCFPTGEAFVVASIEGRVAVEYFDMSPEVQRNKYAFKCHREKDESGGMLQFVDMDKIFVSVSQKWSSLSSLMTLMWKINENILNFARNAIFRFGCTCIMSVSFNATGTQLAIAASYMNELKERPNPEPESTVVVRKITDVEARPK